MDFETYWRNVRRARTGSADRCAVVFHTIASSHDAARRAAAEYRNEGVEPPAVDFLAWCQSAGKGRQGRAWSSPPGAGVYASMIRRVAADRVSRLPLLVPVALAGVLRSHADVPCRLKWPNDLVVDGRKLGGVLIDVLSGSDERPVTILSFGLNHGPDATTGFAEKAAVSTADLGSGLALDELAVAALEELDRRLAAEHDGSPAGSELVEEYRSLCAHRPGDSLDCRLGDDEEKTRGIFRGIDDQGFLRLQVGDEEKVVASGRLLP